MRRDRAMGKASGCGMVQIKADSDVECDVEAVKEM
jgi:hypothetical protein